MRSLMAGLGSGVRDLASRRRPLTLLLVGLLALGGIALVRQGPETRTVSAHFSRAVSVFVGSEVRILGVPVGRVTAVVPDGATVRVEMEYDAGYDVPADAQAVIITPTLTADRFVQLTPAYTGGKQLADGAVIDVKDTGTPVELDRIYRSLADLTTALGPNGVNSDGTLNHVLAAGARMLDGQGAKANRTIVDLSRAVKTFGDGSGELFGTVRALDSFAQTLATNDEAMSRFLGDLGAVSQQLAGEKDELAAVLESLAQVLGKVETFVRDNRKLLTTDVAELSRVLAAIGGERSALETILDVAPSAMGNLAIAFDPKTGSIGSRLGFKGNIQDLDGLLCTLARSGDLPSADQACAVFQQLLGPLADIPTSAPAAPNGGAGEGGRQVRVGTAQGARDLHELLGGAA